MPVLNQKDIEVVGGGMVRNVSKREFCVRYSIVLGVLFFLVRPGSVNAQLDAGIIGVSQCIISGLSPSAFTSIRDASTGAGITISWDRADDNAFTINLSQVSVGSQTYTEGVLAIDKYYRRVVTNGVITVRSNVIRVAVVGVRTDPTFNPVVPPFPIVCQQTTSFPVNYTTTNLPDTYSIFWDATAALAGFQDVVNVTLPATPGSFNVAVPAGAAANIYNGTLIAVISGTGCTVSNASSVQVNPIPSVVINTPSPVCSPNSIDLTNAAITTGSTGGLTYTQWNNALATSSLANANAVTATGVYYIKGTIAATGCAVTKAVTATINPLPTVVTTAQFACTPATIDLTGLSITSAGSTANLSYTQWNNVLATSSLTNASSITATGVYYIKGTIAATGCAVTQPVTATINTSPTVAVVSPAAVCAPGTIDLTSPSITSAGSTANLSYTQWNNALATSSLTNASSVTATGVYYIKGTVAATGCGAVQPVTATVNPLPTVVTTAPSVCFPGTIDLTSPSITSAGSTANLSYTQWNNSLATSSLTNASSITATGVYYIKGTIAITGCAVTKAVTATINSLPTVVITTPTAICAPGTIDLTSPSITSAGSTANLSYTQWNNLLATSSLTNASSISATGVYYIKGTIPATGCGTVQSVTATINPLPTVVITAPSVCSPGTIDLTSPTITSAGSTANLSYTQWNNILATSAVTNASAITATGIYYIKGTIAATGCGIVQPVTATINPLPTVVITAPSVCSPGTIDLTSPAITAAGSTANLSYTQWNNALATSALTNASAVTATGIYYIKGTIAATGCAVTKAVTATINPLPTVVITTPAAICAPGTIDLTSPSITSAGSTANLSYTQWNNVLATSTLTNASAITTTGVYYIRGTIAATGCAVTKAVTATINPLPIVVITAPTVCAPGTIDLTSLAITAAGSTANLSYTQWNNALATSALLNANAITATGVYYIKGTIPVTGCAVTKAVTATIVAAPTLVITNPLAVCAPATVDLTSAAITAGSTPGLVFSYFTNAANTNTLNTPAAVNASGTYYIKGSVGIAGCASSQPVTVTINPLPNGVLQTPSVNYICNGLSLLLTASNANSYQWFYNQQPVTGAVTNSYAATNAGDYTVRFISSAGCVQDATNTISLSLLTKPLLQFADNGSCAGSPIRFTNQSAFTSSGNINWLWNFGDGSVANILSPVYTYPVGGDYIIALTANNLSCPNLTDSILVPYHIEAPRIPYRYATVNAVGGVPTTLSSRNAGSVYLWKPATGLNDARLQFPTATLNSDVEYAITINSAAGCTVTDTVLVKVTIDGSIYVAQAFTPNGDGVNDRCYPIAVGIRSLTYFKIFNRWGNVVFQTNDLTPQNGWDGKWNGKIQPPGTYQWVAEAIDGGGNIIKKTGSVLLVN